MTTSDVAAHQPGAEVDLFESDRRRLNALYRECTVLARSKFVPDVYKNDPDTVYAVARYGQMYGLSPVHSVARIDVIKGRLEPRAEVLGGVVMAAGHELRYDETSSERCTVSIRRAGTDYWQTLTFTIDDARRAGMLDLTAMRWVSTQSGKKYPEEYRVGYVDSGPDAELVDAAPEWAQKEVKNGRLTARENWAKWPADMLAAKAVKRAAKRFCPDALLNLADEGDGMPVEAMRPPDDVAKASDGARDEDQQRDVADEGDDDEDIVDAELVDDDQVSGVAADDAAPADDDEPAGDDVDPEPEHTEPEPIGEQAPPPVAEPAAPAAPDEPLAGATFTRSFAIHVREADMHDGRKLDNDDRHALVAYATGGRTRSVKDVFASEVSGCFTALKRLERGQLVLVDVAGVRQVQEATSSDD